MRPSGRAPDQMRTIEMIPGFSAHAEGSCLVKFGQTHVLVTASVEERLPPWLRGKGSGWVTAEYGMLPRATHTRGSREAAKGKQSGRTQEIQRLIGRSLRAVTDLTLLGERQITLDCDVIQADGGTRTASISGAWVALRLAIDGIMAKMPLAGDPLAMQVAAISCGVHAGQPVLDLDYVEDSDAGTDVSVPDDARGRRHQAGDQLRVPGERQPGSVGNPGLRRPDGRQRRRRPVPGGPGRRRRRRRMR